VAENTNWKHALDVELKESDIAEVTDRDALAALFAKLRYDTSDRMRQVPSNLDISDDTTARSIRHMELLADSQFLQVWLFEVRSVTLQLVRKLANVFRNRAGRFFLVLTSDYERIDFVLVELVLPEEGSKKQVRARPRVFTVNRRDPSRLQMRVLRRFTYTEPDGFAQYDKFQSAYSVVDWSGPLFNNRALFADHFLNERMRELPEWGENLNTNFRAVLKLYASARSRLAGKNEAAVRGGLYEPIFSQLGFDFAEEKPPTSSETVSDYCLKPKDAAGPAVACLTYTWGRSLDGVDPVRDQETPDENPGAAVVAILTNDKAPDWAVVTNGKLWRLYSRQAHSKATSYYEIDLEETLAEREAEGFRYFWLFFRADAFSARVAVVEGEEKETTFLDQILAGSNAFAKRLEKRLKGRVFDRIFPHLAEGFVRSIRASEGAKADLSEERLAQVFEGTLTLLYRLLFLLYAEARDLLPVRELRGYYGKSLRKLCAEIAEKGGTIEDKAPRKLTRAFSPNETALYRRLTELFGIIANGDTEANVPVYNGGLFLMEPAEDDDSAEARNGRFLNTWEVPDRFLALGLDAMARDVDEKSGSLVPIDYRSLGVRQLGSIYEGLLEYRLQKKGKSVKMSQVSEARHSTGSFYTPDFVVKHVVERTVGPLIHQRADQLRPAFRKVQKAAKARADGRPVPENADRELVDRLFDLTVLDPAMGSGHFLVETVDVLSDRFITFLAGFTNNPVSAEFAATRREILDEMERQGVTIDAARLTDVNLTKRYVLKRCIYGVDLNSMAVELAKVSLWLNSFTLGAPLSFLDHHLRPGNALAGTTVVEVKDGLRQQDLFARDQFADLALATNLMQQVADLSDVTAQQVDASRDHFRKAAQELRPYKRILDLYTTRHFGPKKKGKKPTDPPIVTFLKSDTLRSVAEADDPGAEVASLPSATKKLVNAALDLVQKYRLFHWELEFPEIYFQGDKSRKNAGFHAVVGNPPWIRQESVKALKPLLQHSFPETYNAVAGTGQTCFTPFCPIARMSQLQPAEG